MSQSANIGGMEPSKHGQREQEKVQWVYIGGQRRNARVLRVLEYNGQTLADPLDDNALAALLGTYDARDDDQDDFFRR